jgi:hypothetical protein
MFALVGAKFAAADTASEGRWEIKLGAMAAIAAASVLSACMPATIPLAGADPADPAAKVAGVHYRSTIAPYTRMRPSAPGPWRERNDNVTPQPKSDQ